MKFLYDFWAIHLWYVLGYVVSFCVANRVETMHELLSSSGWFLMARSDHQVEIVDRRWTETQLTVNYLLATPVTEENAVDKIQVAHQFLSCSYARVLMDLCEYEEGIGPYCMSTECLQDYLQVTRYKLPLVSRMIGALSSLQDLAFSQTQFEKRVYEILGDLQNYYRQNTVVRPPSDDYQTTREFVKAESEAIQQRARIMTNRLFAFYNRFCRPLSYWLLMAGYSKPMDDIIWIAERYYHDSVSVVYEIKEKLANIIKEFTESHDATSGFEYDPESHTTRIMTYDPNTMELVEKMKQLLGNRHYWLSLKPLEIKERDSPYRTNIDDLLKPADGPYNTVIVTKDNVYAKLKRAHHFLSCKYASILKECCDHVAGMWTNCHESKNSDCLEKFLQILNDSDPSVLRMIDALSYFYKLSPATVYNKGVFDFMTRFKNFYKDRTAWVDRNVRSCTPEIEKYISEIAHNSSEFYHQFCHSEDEFELESYYFTDDVKYGTIDVKGEVFKKRIHNLTYIHAVFQSL